MVKKKCLPGHVWLKSQKGAEGMFPIADAPNLTTSGRKPFEYVYPEDDPRTKETKKTKAE